MNGLICVCVRWDLILFIFIVFLGKIDLFIFHWLLVLSVDCKLCLHGMWALLVHGNVQVTPVQVICLLDDWAILWS